MLCIDDVMLFANTLEDAQKLTRALEEFSMRTKLSVNSSKMKMILARNKNKAKLGIIMYNNEPLKTMGKIYIPWCRSSLNIDGMNFLPVV